MPPPSSPPSTWQAKAATKRAALAGSLPPGSLLPPNLLPPALPPNASVLDLPATSGLLSPLQICITDQTDPSRTLAKLRTGELSSAEVCEAFLVRAAIAQQATGCLTEFLADRARRRAAELDKTLKETGEVSGPLHG